MSGQCFGCGAEFGRFKKEHGCKNCGFAFCNKCLHEKSIPVPKRNNMKHHVCLKCFKILTGAASQSTEQQKIEPPEAYLKRIAALKEREATGQSSHTAHPSGGSKAVPEHLLRLEKADREIAMRLEKLKEPDQPSETVSETDLRRSLAQLKGQSDVHEPKSVYKPPDHKSETQQVDDLIEQLISEVDIDSLRPDPAQDVESRLAKFRQEDGTKAAIDKNNLSETLDRPEAGNDLNKIDKMGAIGRGHSPDGVNIKTGRPGPSVDHVDLEEVQRLMLQAGKEAELDADRAMSGMKQDTELMNKLRLLQKQKGDTVSFDPDNADSDADNTAQTGNTAASDDEDDDACADQLVQQYLAEVKIDEAIGGSTLKKDKPSQLSSSGKINTDGRKNKPLTDLSPTSVELKPSNLEPPMREDLVDSDYDDADELPYCCVCTEDATVRCRDCDMDLYCQRCFKGCHEEMAITDHRTSPYKAPKGYR